MSLIGRLGRGQSVIASLFDRTPLDAAVEALARDLRANGGPAISTMRNYRFAILAYAPSLEFRLRNRIRALGDELIEAGWQVLSISLHALLVRRLRAIGDEALQSIIARETRTWVKDPDRALAYLVEQVTPWIEGENGIAGEVVSRIDEFARDRSLEPERTAVFLGRAAALYPFFRSSSLLKHLDGRTFNLPTVLLYPGERKDTGALSFMGRLPADRDYRPRIYA
jgi:hypothetical protein